jgi:hypothetical protein
MRQRGGGVHAEQHVDMAAAMCHSIKTQARWYDATNQDDVTARAAGFMADNLQHVRKVCTYIYISFTDARNLHFEYMNNGYLFCNSTGKHICLSSCQPGP